MCGERLDALHMTNAQLVIGRRDVHAMGPLTDNLQPCLMPQLVYGLLLMFPCIVLPINKGRTCRPKLVRQSELQLQTSQARTCNMPLVPLCQLEQDGTRKLCVAGATTCLDFLALHPQSTNDCTKSHSEHLDKLFPQCPAISG